MSVVATVEYQCGGCDAKAESEPQVMRRQFVSFSGRSWGFGSYQSDKLKIEPPEGWVAFDPYTQCCYCPKCWDEIEGDIRNDTG